MWETLLGGLLAVLGGWGSSYLHIRYARKNKMEEVVAERKVTANAQGYSYMKEIISLFNQENPKVALDKILSHEEWFFNNRLFLPGEFPSKWLSVRNDLRKLVGRQKGNIGTTEELTNIDKQIESTCTEAIMEVYKDMNLKPISVRESNK